MDRHHSVPLEIFVIYEHPPKNGWAQVVRDSRVPARIEALERLDARKARMRLTRNMRQAQFYKRPRVGLFVSGIGPGRWRIVLERGETGGVNIFSRGHCIT